MASTSHPATNALVASRLQPVPRGWTSANTLFFPHNAGPSCGCSVAPSCSIEPPSFRVPRPATRETTASSQLSPLPVMRHYNPSVAPQLAPLLCNQAGHREHNEALLSTLGFPSNPGESRQQKRLFCGRTAGSNVADKAAGSSRAGTGGVGLGLSLTQSTALHIRVLTQGITSQRRLQ